MILPSSDFRFSIRLKYSEDSQKVQTLVITQDPNEFMEMTIQPFKLLGLSFQKVKVRLKARKYGFFYLEQISLSVLDIEH